MYSVQILFPPYVVYHTSGTNAAGCLLTWQVFRKIMAMWIGLGMRESFAEWKTWTKRRIKQRRKDTRKVMCT